MEYAYGLLSQSAEEVGSNPIQFRFESEVTHQYVQIAQMVERWVEVPCVIGSSPILNTILKPHTAILKKYG